MSLLEAKTGLAQVLIELLAGLGLEPAAFPRTLSYFCFLGTHLSASASALQRMSLGGSLRLPCWALMRMLLLATGGLRWRLALGRGLILGSHICYNGKQPSEGEAMHLHAASRMALE